MSAPERVWVRALTAPRVPARVRAAAALTARAHPGDALVMSTCRRVEVIGVGEPPSAEALFGVEVPPEAITSFDDRAAVTRVLRVSTGLESVVLGEDQILHQLRAALAQRRLAGPVPAALGRLIEAAIRTGREARRAAPRREHSLAERALAVLADRFGGLAGRRLLIAGAGPIGQAAARRAVALGARVTIASRDRSRAAGIAAGLGASATSLDAAVADIGSTDALLVALAGAWPSLEAASTPLPFVVDLSDPVVVPEALIARLGSRFVDLDRLASEQPADRLAEATYRDRADSIVDLATSEYLDWARGRQSIGVLRRLRGTVEARRRRELDRLFRRLPELDQRERDLIARLSAQLVASVLHEPSVRLRADGDGRGARAAMHLFGLADEL